MIKTLISEERQYLSLATHFLKCLTNNKHGITYINWPMIKTSFVRKEIASTLVYAFVHIA